MFIIKITRRQEKRPPVLRPLFFKKRSPTALLPISLKRSKAGGEQCLAPHRNDSKAKVMSGLYQRETRRNHARISISFVTSATMTITHNKAISPIVISCTRSKKRTTQSRHVHIKITHQSPINKLLDCQYQKKDSKTERVTVTKSEPRRLGLLCLPYDVVY